MSDSSDSTGTTLLYSLDRAHQRLSRKVDQLQVQLHEVQESLKTIEKQLQLLVDFHDRMPVHSPSLPPQGSSGEQQRS